MKLRGYALGSLASVAVHVLVLTLLALAWRADSLRRAPDGNAPIPVWLVADRQAATGAAAPEPASAPPASSPVPHRPLPGARPGPRPEPAPLSAPEAAPAPAPAPATPPDPLPAPPAPSADRAPSVPEQASAVADDGATAGSAAPGGAAPEADRQAAHIDRDYRALSRPEPAYPQQALARGIEGNVILEFTVTAAGTTRDLRVLEASPEGVFEAAALEAAREFRYRPRVVAGAPVDVPGVRSRIRFQIRPR